MFRDQSMSQEDVIIKAGLKKQSFVQEVCVCVLKTFQVSIAHDCGTTLQDSTILTATHDH